MSFQRRVLCVTAKSRMGQEILGSPSQVVALRKCGSTDYFSESSLDYWAKKSPALS